MLHKIKQLRMGVLQGGGVRRPRPGLLGNHGAGAADLDSPDFSWGLLSLTPVPKCRAGHWGVRWRAVSNRLHVCYLDCRNELADQHVQMLLPGAFKANAGGGRQPLGLLLCSQVSLVVALPS